MSKAELAKAADFFSGSNRRGRLSDSDRADQAEAMNQGMTVLAYLLSGVAVYGFFGWLGDHLLHAHFLLPTGIVLGAAGAIYMIIRRFGNLGGTTQVTPTQPTDKSREGR